MRSKWMKFHVCYDLACTQQEVLVQDHVTNHRKVDGGPADPYSPPRIWPVFFFGLSGIGGA